MGEIEVIVGGLIGGGFVNNARKRHLWAMMAVKNKK